jgi:hypothetical protein
MDIADSMVNSYIFHTSSDGMMKGGYKIQDERMIGEKMIGERMIGGSGVGLSRFENLVVPIGLVHTPNKTLISAIKPKESEQDVISDEIFDKLFSSVLHIKKSSNSRTKKHFTEQNRKTKKQEK